MNALPFDIKSPILLFLGSNGNVGRLMKSVLSTELDIDYIGLDKKSQFAIPFFDKSTGI